MLLNLIMIILNWVLKAILKKKTKLQEGNQEGRTEGCGSYHLPQKHQKYIYMWNNPHRTPTECWQKSSYNQSYKTGYNVTR